MNPITVILLHAICFARKSFAGQSTEFHTAGMRRGLALICPICRYRRQRAAALREYRPILRVARLALK